jgi:hypothetical protein
MLSRFNFAKWYIDDIIIFNLTYEDHMLICRKCLKNLMIITLIFLYSSGVLGLYDLFRWIGGPKGQN